MKQVRILSKVLYWFSIILLALYGSTFLHAFIALTFKTSSLNIIDNGTRFEIYYPFAKVSFLIGYFEKGYIIFGFLLVLAFYALFFYLLARFFKAFTADKLFTLENYKAVKWFSYANLILPLVGAFLSSFYFPLESEIYILVGLHVLLGIFAYFLAAIFMQGLQLQKDQDLFI